MNGKKKLDELINEAEFLCETLPDEKQPGCRHLLNQLQAFSEDYLDLRMILNGLSEQFFITDSEENVLFVNNAYSNASKLLPEQLIGKTVTALVEEDHFFKDPIIPKVIKEKKELQEIAYIGEDDSPVFLIGSPIFDSDGSLRYVVSNDYRPEDISNLQYYFARFEEQKTLEKKNAELDYFRQYVNGNKNYCFGDPVMLQIVDLVKSIGNTDVTVLITGESGTGKEVIADLLCQNSNRSNQPFIKVNCAAIPESLIESELFGYEKGSFTGADKNGKMGMMELADKGTLFLDEIGDIPLPLQTKLLRVLQEKKIRRVGGTKEIPVDIRIVAATNRDLQKEVNEGNFRKDLYYRLNVIPIHLPSLRERPKDIRLLIDHFLEKYTSRYHKSVKLSEEAISCLCEYSWPGNIRELKNVLERIVVISSYGVIPMETIQLALGIAPQTTSADTALMISQELPASTPPQDLNLKKAKDSLEKEYIKVALSQYPSKRQAAKSLGIDHSTLVLKCQKYGL